MTAVDPYPHDKAVIARLQTIGRPVGFGVAPDGALAGVLSGSGSDYLVLYPLNGSTLDGTLSDPYADADLSYQVTCVGQSAEGVRWLVGRIEPALAGLTITGRAVTQIVPEDIGGVRLDPDIQPDSEGRGVLIATPRYRIHTTPA